jgi:predicted membrane protein
MYMRERPIVTPGLVIGLFALAAGVILLLDRQGIVDAHYLFHFFWPALLLAAGIFRLAQRCEGPGRIWGGILTAAGIVLFLDRLGYAHLSFRDLWPLFLIAIGLMFVWQALSWGGHAKRVVRSVSAINAWAAFGGGEIKSDTKDFQGGEVLAVFGGYDIDLRGASIQSEEVVLYANAIFGGIGIKVPETWFVSMQGSPILGGYSDKTHKPDAGENGTVKRLVIRGFALFGGVEVKN